MTRKLLQGIGIVMMVLFLSALNAGAVIKADYWVETEKIVKVSTGVEGYSFQISVKSWDTDASLEGISVRAEFQEEVKEALTNDKGQVFFPIPQVDEEEGRNITVSLPNFPEVKPRVVTVVYKHHLKYFGPAFTGVEGIGKGNYFPETSSFSNIALIQSKKGGVQADIDKVMSAGQHKIWSFISVDHIFFIGIYDDEGGVLLDVKLRSDYLKRWMEYANKIEPFADTVLGFFVFDEPYWTAIQCGKSFREMRLMLEEVAFQIKQSFPTKKIGAAIFITERELKGDSFLGYPLPENAKEEYGIPVGLDWICLYYYWEHFQQYYPEGSLSQFREIWGERLQSFNKHFSKNQGAVLVPGTYSYSPEKTEETLVALAEEYYSLAKRDIRIEAIMPFLWPNAGEGMLGLEEMPLLQQVWANYGREIISQQ